MGLTNYFKILCTDLDHSPLLKCLPKVHSKGVAKRRYTSLLCWVVNKLLYYLKTNTENNQVKLALTFLFLSRCLRTATAFLIKCPFDLRILKILFPVTKESGLFWPACRSVPLHHQK
uniref:Uncharacterized protein n=1 Tax=Amazona collaria TaxID=241587 RepID=A0A8B9IY27_9PSIT